MRRYCKILGLRAWGIVRRPIWGAIVVVTTLFTLSQLVARAFAERLVNIFDALYQWWYVPLGVLAACILLLAGYEAWKEEEEARKKAETKLREAERERNALHKDLEAARASASYEDWGEREKTRVVGKTFRNEPITLDDHAYEDCIFINITLVYKGEGPFALVRCAFRENLNIDAPSPPLQGLMLLLRNAGLMKDKLPAEESPLGPGPKPAPGPAIRIEGGGTVDKMRLHNNRAKNLPLFAADASFGEFDAEGNVNEIDPGDDPGRRKD